MRPITATILAAGLLSALLLAGPSAAQDGALEAGPPAVEVYSNSFAERDDMQELDKLGAGRCARRHETRGENMSVEVGKQTQRCEYSTPVVGRNLDISATVVLSKETPLARRKKIFLSVGLRTADLVGYVFEVYPRTRSWFLRRVVPGEDGEPHRRTFAKGEGKIVATTGRKNRIRLRAFGDELIAWVNGEVVARGTDPEVAQIDGRLSTIGIGASANASQAVGIFDNVIVQVPDPLL